MTGLKTNSLTHDQITAFYQEKAIQSSNISQQLHRKYNQYAIVRLISFLVGVGILAVLFTFHWAIGLASTVLFLMAFYRFVLWHQAIKDLEIHHSRLADINDKELLAMDNDFSAFADGAKFIEPTHPNLIDLDLFGRHSIFQACNRTATVLGRKLMADILKKPAVVEDIAKRQVAIQELTPMTDWRQDFQAIGMHKEDDEEHLKRLQMWLDMPPFFEGRAYLKWMRFFVPVWMAAGLVICFTVWPLEAFLVFLILPAVILQQNIKAITEYHEKTAKAVDIIEKYGQLIAHVEKQSFNSELLKGKKELLLTDDILASKSIRKLAYIISQLNVRYNAFAIILSLFSLWEVQWLKSLETWKDKFGAKLPGWFDGLKYFDALNSFAILSANNPDWIMPNITSEDKLEAVGLAHPLLHHTKRVDNDITLPTNGHIKLITGSNMGGKSTFLRTVGLNVALAMCGLPVCARKFNLPPLWVYTSMRTQDSLHESTSSFWAELKRLKTIIAAVEENKETKAPKPQILFLLDEILKGTNSADRHKGSKALLLQLIEAKGSGLVATHDLELGSMAEQIPEGIENWCFEVAIEEGRLHFDYKLKRGVSKSFNATILMREMGINV